MKLKTPRLIILIFSLICLFYVLGAFLAPIILRNGNYILGNGIYEVYGKFCHQRVERSLFLFGKDHFYSIKQLKEERFLPQEDTTNSYVEYFGHNFNGNDTVGYKVAICIRDIALYGTVGVFGLLFAFWGKIKRYNPILIYALITPIFIDVFIQIIIEIFKIQPVPYWFLDSYEKRIITGILAGCGLIFLLSNILVNSLTKSK